METSNNNTLATMSLVFGALGLLFVFMGCFFGPAGMLAMVFCPLGLILGLVEMQKIGSGTSSEANRSMAMAGAATGGTGCLLQAVITLALFAFLGLYFVALFGLIVLGN